MKISVITVCYNSKEYIERCINSVISQRNADFEYIIIDGGSTDGTLELIKKYDSYISFWLSEPDEGIYQAMNKGLKHISGDVVAFLNSDDFYEDDALSVVTQYYSNNKIQILSGEVAIVSDRRRVRKYEIFNQELIHQYAIYHHQGLFVRRELFDQVGCFNENYKIGSDYEWMIKAHNKGIDFFQIPNVLVNFSDSGVSMNNIADRYVEYREISLNNMGNHSEEFINKIRQYYDEAVDFYETDKKVDEILKKEEKIELDIFLNSDKVYIFGGGFYLNRSVEILSKMGVGIFGVIDKNASLAENGKILFFRAYTPQEIDDNACILISSYKYEKEIYNDLLKTKRLIKKCITLREIEKRIVQRYLKS